MYTEVSPRASFLLAQATLGRGALFVGNDAPFATTLDMQLPALPELATFLALSYRPAFLLYFEQRAVGVVARARAVAFDARLTVHR